MMKAEKTGFKAIFGNHSQTGFSLLEVLIVVAMISIVATISVVYTSQWLPGIRLRSAARDLYGNMQKARLLAVKNNINIAVVSDPANKQYGVCNSGGADDDWATFADNGKEYKVEFSGVYKSPTITYSTDEFLAAGSTVNAIVFSPDGSSTAGFFYLENTDPKSDAVYAVGTRGANGKVILRKK